MHSVEGYLSRQRTDLVEQIIRDYCVDRYQYDEHAVLIACAELAKRRGENADPFADFRQLCEAYLK